MATGNRIYVQIDISAPIERVWELTQTPGDHQKWDLRFTEIEYLPRPNTDEPQRFVYATRLGFGLSISGWGETAGTHERDGSRTSALRFGSDERLSLIREGSGYWKYEPRTSGLRFSTAYDYEVRYGTPGRLFDRCVFRPLIGWATAWSFDRLRLWSERGIDPAVSFNRSLVHAIARTAVAGIWLYQGIVPKLLHRHPDEIALLRLGGLAAEAASVVCVVLGVLEVVLGIVLLVAWRASWPIVMTLVLMPLAVMSVALTEPRFMWAAFNPVSLNLGAFGLALIAFVGARDLPSARNCLRTPEGVR